MEASIFIADGVEECEALLVVDLLRRGGIEIQTVAVNDDPGEDEKARTIVSSHRVPLICDVHINNFAPSGEKVLIIPGGKLGVDNLKASARLSQILHSHQGNLAAVCAGPTVLGALGLLDGHKATVYPGFQDGLGNADFTDTGLIRDGRILTARALGSSIDFALAIVTLLRDESQAQTVAAQICYQTH